MPRYIDADAYEFPGDLLHVPTADVVEVKRGEWIVKVRELTMCKKVYCSVCGYSEIKGPSWEENWGLHNFCPNCGAKMKESD